MALYVIRLLFGEEVKRKVAKEMEYACLGHVDA